MTFKKIFRILLTFDAKSFRDYLKNLGLACVVGSVTGFFLKSHTNHQLISLATLFTIGTLISYFGVRGGNNHD